MLILPPIDAAAPASQSVEILPVTAPNFLANLPESKVIFPSKLSGKYTLPSSLENAPDSYFATAKTAEVFNPATNEYEKVDVRALYTLKLWRLTNEHIARLLEHKISLEAAAEQIKFYQKEGSIKNDIEPWALVEALLFELEHEAYDSTNGLFYRALDAAADTFHKIRSVFGYENPKGVSLLLARQHLESGLIEFDEALLPFIRNWEGSNDILTDDIRIERIPSATKFVFTLSNYPGQIFKIMSVPRHSPEKIQESFKKRVQTQKIIMDLALDCLVVPKLRSILLDDNGTTLLIEEMLPISNHMNGHQAELFTNSGKSLYRAIRQMTTFMLKGFGLGDLHRSNLLILDGDDGKGNRRFGLIDLDHLGESVTSSLFGKTEKRLDLGTARGLMQMLSTSQIEELRAQVIEDLGPWQARLFFLVNRFDKFRKDREEIYDYECRLRKFHAKKGLLGATPIHVTLEDLGFFEKCLESSRSLHTFPQTFPCELEDMLRTLVIDINNALDNRRLVLSKATVREQRYIRIRLPHDCSVKQAYDWDFPYRPDYKPGEGDVNYLLLEKLKEYGFIFDFEPCTNHGTHIQL